MTFFSEYFWLLVALASLAALVIFKVVDVRLDRRSVLDPEPSDRGSDSAAMNRFPGDVFSYRRWYSWVLLFIAVLFFCTASFTLALALVDLGGNPAMAVLLIASAVVQSAFAAWALRDHRRSGDMLVLNPEGFRWVTRKGPTSPVRWNSARSRRKSRSYYGGVDLLGDYGQVVLRIDSNLVNYQRAIQLADKYMASADSGRSDAPSTLR